MLASSPTPPSLSAEGDPWLTAGEAAAYARCHIQTLRTALRTKELNGCRRGNRGWIKIKKSWIDKWLKKGLR